MASISGKRALSAREIYYFRQRFKNRIFQSIVAFFADKAEKSGLTKKDVATSLGKDPAQITRWLAGPGNLTMDTVSDLLLAMDCELEFRIEPIELRGTTAGIVLAWENSEPRKSAPNRSTTPALKIVRCG